MYYMSTGMWWIVATVQRPWSGVFILATVGHACVLAIYNLCIFATNMQTRRFRETLRDWKNRGQQQSTSPDDELQLTCYLNPPKNLENNESSSRMSENGLGPPETRRKLYKNKITQVGWSKCSRTRVHLLFWPAADLVWLVQSDGLVPLGWPDPLNESL